MKLIKNNNIKNNCIKKAVDLKIRLKKAKEQLIEEESGMGIVEIAIIILVIISLALLFQEEVEGFLGEIFDKFDINTFAAISKIVI